MWPIFDTDTLFWSLLILTTAAPGFALVAYALYTLFANQLCLPPRLERWLSPLTGLTTGVITGGTGVFVIPAVPYLQALGVSRGHSIQVPGLSFTVSTIALAAGLALHGSFNVGNPWPSALLVVPALMVWPPGRGSDGALARPFSAKAS